MNKDSKAIYPTQENGKFENYIAKTTFAEDYWEDIEAVEESSVKNKNPKQVAHDYSMEVGEEITFEDLNDDDLISESHVDIDSIIRNMDMSDHNYRDNLW